MGFPRSIPWFDSDSLEQKQTMHGAVTDIPPHLTPALQASFDEQINHIIRKLHYVFVQPQHLQDKSLGGNVEHQVIFARPIDDIPDFDRLVVRSGDDLGPVRGKRDRVDVVAVRIRLLAHQLQLACQTSQQASVLAKEGRL
jgi:hypothetical protein